MLVVILHAPEEEQIADRLAQPIREIGYDTWSTAEVLVGDQLVGALSQRLAVGGPVVICGTMRAAGSKWFGRILSHVNNPMGDGRTRVFPVRMEPDANLESLTWSAKIAECCPDLGKGVSDLSKSLATYFPLSARQTAVDEAILSSAGHNGNFDGWLTNRTDYSIEALRAYRESLRSEIRENRLPDSLDGLAFLHESGLMSHGKLYAAGVLLFSELPQQLVQSAFVQCVKYSGSDQTAALTLSEYDGTLLTQMQKAMTFIQSHTESVEVLAPGALASRQDFRFPMVCIREILANALCHRDYRDLQRHTHVRVFNDRIEIVSPGEWVSKAIKDDHLYELAQLRSEPASRNERLATALRRVKLVETEGSGIPNAVRDCAETDAPSPTVISQDSMVKVTVFPRSDWGSGVLSRRATVRTEPLNKQPPYGPQAKLIAALRQDVETGSLLVVVGAGISLQASGGDPRASFDGLVRNGIERAANLSVVTSAEADALRSTLGQKDPYQRLDVAGVLSERLGPREFGSWLQDAVGKIPLRATDQIEAIDSLRNTIATTNYDDLISRALNYDPVVWTNKARVIEVLSGSRHGVLHLHGFYAEPESVILDARSQETIAKSHDLTSLWDQLRPKKLLFVGFDTGDPNFNALLAWRRSAGNGPVDYLLCRAEDVDRMTTGQLQAIAYGDSYADLAPFIRQMTSQPEAVTAVTLAPPRKRLPYPWLMPWVGREREMAALGDALRTSRLVTLHGMGGVGKTRLAVETLLAHGDELPRQIAFVALENVPDKLDGVLTAVRDALGLTEIDTPDVNALCRRLRGTDLLLLMDNFESVMSAVDLVLRLAETSGVKVLVTSQRALEIPGERVVELEPMATADSYRLFVDLAQQRDITWRPDNDDAMQNILAATDGLPYLLEIVAAAAPKRRLEQLAKELATIRAKHPLKERHTSVQACLEWALGRLPVAERAVLPRLSIFAGSFEETAALEIAATPLASLDTLVDASVLRFDRETGRYSMLATTRQFVRGLLNKEELTPLAAAHARWFIERLDGADNALRAKGGETQAIARRWIDHEYENVQQAVGWAERHDQELFKRAVYAYGIYLAQTYRFSEDVRLNEALLRLVHLEDDARAWATTQNSLGGAYLRLPTGDLKKNISMAIACYEAALTVWTEHDFPREWAATQNNLGTAYSNLPTGDRSRNVAKAIVCYESALHVWSESDFPADWATTQNNLAKAYSDLPTGDRNENLAKAIACYQAALRIRTEHDFPMQWATTQNNLGVVYRNLSTGDHSESLTEAIAHYEAALRIFTERDFPVDWAMAQNNLGTAYLGLRGSDRDENFAKAIACYQAALRVRTEHDFPADWASTQRDLGAVYEEMAAGEPGHSREQAIRCYESAARGYAAVGLTSQVEDARQRAADLAAPNPIAPQRRPRRSSHKPPMLGKFVIEKGSAGKYRFNLKADNNEIVLTSETYESKSGAENAIESVRTNSQDDSRFTRMTATDGSPYFVLTADNGKTIGKSEMYSSTTAMENGIKSVTANAPDAAVVDETA